MSQLEPLPDDFGSVLAIVAHPDDLEYGAAAAIATWTDAGKSVAYVLVTRGEAGIDSIAPKDCAPLREAEQRAAAACVGVDIVEFLDHRDGVIMASLELRRDLSAAIRRHRPEVVLIINHHDNWGGRNRNSADHRNTGTAAIDAVSDAGNRWIFPDLAEAGLHPWNGVKRILVAGSPHATHAVVVERGLERAIASLEAHATYLANLGGAMGDARSFVTANAMGTGERFGGRPAISFEVIG
jgi:LmbE family N-acetylglucosaminyl deacetylase